MRVRLVVQAVLALGIALLAGCSPGRRVELDFLPYLDAGGYRRFTASIPGAFYDIRGQEVQITFNFRAPPSGASISYTEVEVSPTATGTLHYEFEVYPITITIPGAEPSWGWVEISLFVAPGDGSPWGTRVAGPKRLGPASAGARWTWKGKARLDQTLTRGLASGSATFGVRAHPVDYYVRLPDLNGSATGGNIVFIAALQKLLLTVP